MKRTLLNTLHLLTVCTLLFSSCGTTGIIQKRKYTKGWHVSNLPKSFDGKQSEMNEDLVVENKTVATKKETAKPVSEELIQEEAQEIIKSQEDKLILEASVDNSIIENDLTQLSTGNIIDKIPSSVEKREVRKMNHARTKNLNKKSDVVEESETNSGGKSQLIALLLVFFVGVIGIHRFYLGYPVIGVIQIITLGGIGIWTLIDLIRIILGTLKPKDGEYDETL